MLKLFKAISLFIGTVIGAGIFGIPYTIEKSGIVAGFFYFIVLGGVVLLIHLFFGEIILRTKECCRLPGLAKKYLGEKGKVLVMISVVSGLTGALLAYLILSGEFLKILFPDILNFSPLDFSLLFWAVLSYFIFRGVKLIASVELLTNIVFFLANAVILFFILPKFDFSNLKMLDAPNIFLPFGVILFSLVGWSAIPEIADFFKTSLEKKKVKKTILLSTAIIIPFYLIFTLAVLGATDGDISQDAFSSLVPFLGQKIIVLGVVAALITLADSVLVLGLYLKNTFIYDFKITHHWATIITCGLPLILFLIGFRSFIGTLGFVGTIVGVIEGVAIILIFKKIKKLGNRQPEYSLKVPVPLLYFLIIVLIFGGLSQFLIK